MRFVSKSANYTFVARPDVTQLALGPGGVMIPTTVQNAISCDFTHGMVRPDEAMIAAEKWLGMGSHRDGTPAAFGAAPLTTTGVVNGVAHDGWNPSLTFSVFDTDSIPNEDDRKYAEKRLMEDSENGTRYILVSGRKLEAPWPSYDDIRGAKGRSAASVICSMIRDGGYDLEYVLAYELASPVPRERVTVAIEELRAELIKEAAEDASLMREIPA